MSIANVTSNRDLLDRILRSTPVTDRGLKRLRRMKAVSKLWCRVARHVITDSAYFDSNDNDVPLGQWEMLLKGQKRFCLPLQVTLHPKSMGNGDGYGPSIGQLEENPGNPHCSVFGTLRDLVLLRTNPSCDMTEADYEIRRMVLEVDGVEEPFDTAWGAMATKFKLDRACMYDTTSRRRHRMRNELELLDIGFNLQNKFWLPLDKLDSVILVLREKLYRSNGAPCVLNTGDGS